MIAFSAILACVVITFLFSGIESGVVAVNRIRLRHQALLGEPAAVQLEELLREPARLMATVVMINFSARVLGLGMLFAAYSAHLGPWLAATAFALSLPVLAALFEFLPKALFRRFPYRTLIFFARILSVANRLLLPLSLTAAKLTGPLLRLSTEKTARRLASVAEIRKVTNDAADRELLTGQQKHYIHSLLNARDITAGQILIPIDKVVGLPVNAEVTEAFNIAREQKLDRLPLIESNGHISGLINTFDLLIDGTTSGRVQSYARRVVEIAPHESIIDVLAKLRAARLTLAVIVAGKNQKPLGILTAERIVRRLLLG